MTGAPSFRSQTVNPAEPLAMLRHDLGSSERGLTRREAARRLTVYGPNELVRRGRTGWPREIARQLTHPLALLLWLAAGLAFADGTTALGVAILAVILLNALLAFAQERQAERAVEALASYLPEHARVLRDGIQVTITAIDLVPGDVLVLTAGDRVSADARLLEGALDVDTSALTGESVPVTRAATPDTSARRLLHRRDIVLSGTVCTAGDATALVFATAMATEIGRIAALSQRVGHQDSPLESQVKRVAWLIAAVALGAALAFLPIGTLVARLPLQDAAIFAIGLLVANVPEGLLPTITLALAVGVRSLARSGALVKRLSAVETLGSTNVICTDKTGTLTQNRMLPVSIWSLADQIDLSEEGSPQSITPALHDLAWACAACNDAEITEESTVGDPTELALLRIAYALGVEPVETWREQRRLTRFAFDPGLRIMSTVDDSPEGRVIHSKGAPEDVLARCDFVVGSSGSARLLSGADRTSITQALAEYAARGLRVLAIAIRRLRADEPAPSLRSEAERSLTFLGLVTMSDPPRPEVAGAVRRCHSAGIRMIVVTGDYGPTAAELARQIGIVGPDPTVVTGSELDALSEQRLDDLLTTQTELIFARTSPEAKLRIADALKDLGNVVAMTGDGVNDAPALRRADIGVAMGISGTDVAREASTMVLTDDNFATIVAAVEAGRRVYDNVRKFIVYIFAHATPEVVPFLVFALSGGRVPLPLTVLQILAIDLGTETLPALALGREPAEPGLMDRPPRPRTQGVIDKGMLARSWLLLGGISAVLVLFAYFVTLYAGGWSPGAATGPGADLNHAWRQATTVTFLGIVACQVGTAVAARTQIASLRSVGLFTNRLLIWGIVFELAFAAAVVAVPVLQSIFGTAMPSRWQVAMLVPFPLIVWGADETYRSIRRKRHDLRFRNSSAHEADARASDLH